MSKQRLDWATDIVDMCKNMSVTPEEALAQLEGAYHELAGRYARACMFKNKYREKLEEVAKLVEDYKDDEA